MKSFDVEVKKLRYEYDICDETKRNLPYVVTVNGRTAKSMIRHCRSVFRFSIGKTEYVIKVEDGVNAEDHGWGSLFGQCYDELIFMSHKIKDEDRQYFVAIEGAGIVAKDKYIFAYTIQKYIRGRRYKWTTEKLDILEKIVIKYKFDDVFQDGNCKLDINGNIKIFDYAI